MCHCSLHNRGCTQAATLRVDFINTGQAERGAPLSSASRKPRPHLALSAEPPAETIPLTFLTWKCSGRSVSWISCSVPRGAACMELRNPSRTPLNVNFFIVKFRVADPLSESRSRRPRLHHSRPPRTASRFWRKKG